MQCDHRTDAECRARKCIDCGYGDGPVKEFRERQKKRELDISTRVLYGAPPRPGPSKRKPVKERLQEAKEKLASAQWEDAEEIVDSLIREPEEPAAPEPVPVSHPTWKVAGTCVECGAPIVVLRASSLVVSTEPKQVRFTCTHWKA